MIDVELVVASLIELDLFDKLVLRDIAPTADLDSIAIWQIKGCLIYSWNTNQVLPVPGVTG